MMQQFDYDLTEDYDSPSASTVVNNSLAHLNHAHPHSEVLDAPDQMIVYCSLKNGLPFSAEFKADDVAKSVLVSSDVIIKPIDQSEPGQLHWSFRCASSELEFLVDEVYVVMQQKLGFTSTRPSGPDNSSMVHIWYVSCDRSDTKSVTGELIADSVKSRADIDLVPVMCAQAHNIVDAKRSKFEFLCKLDDVRKLQEELTTRIMVKRCAFELDVGACGTLPAPPVAMAGAANVRDLPPRAPPQINVASREGQEFDTLSESHLIVAARMVPGEVAFADHILNGLYLHFSYEYK